MLCSSHLCTGSSGFIHTGPSVSTTTATLVISTHANIFVHDALSLVMHGCNVTVTCIFTKVMCIVRTMIEGLYLLWKAHASALIEPQCNVELLLGRRGSLIGHSSNCIHSNDFTIHVVYLNGATPKL